MERYDNISIVQVVSANGSFLVGVPEDPTPNFAYFVPSIGAFDGFATVPVADEHFETDNADFRAQIGKIQYAPRILVITGKIYTPKKTDAETAFSNRCTVLRGVQRVLAAAQSGLNLNITLADNTTYMLYCHLHGAEALRVQKNPEFFDVVLTLEAEDPLFYKTAAAQTGTVVNSGDVPEYAAIVLTDCHSVGSYQCKVDETIVGQVLFLAPVNGTVKIDVAYPGQICSISGTTHIGNIDISNGKSAFLRVPVGTSTWTRTSTDSRDSGTVVVYPRSPVIGVVP